jgi:hypothetical protein
MTNMTTDVAVRFAPCFVRVAATLLIGSLLWGCDRKPDATPGSAPGSTPTAKPKAYGSNLELLDCQMIAGWAWDASQPNTPIKVDVYDGSTLLGTVVAGIARKDLADAGKGDGRHGFKFPVPPALKDGKPHVIKVTISGTTLQLANSPKNLVCPEPGSGTGTGTGTGTDTDSGTGTGTGTDTGNRNGTDTDTGNRNGTDTGTRPGTGKGAGTDNGTESGTDTGNRNGTGTGNGTDPDTGTGRL